MKSASALRVTSAFDFSLTDESGNTLEPVFGPGLTSIQTSATGACVPTCSSPSPTEFSASQLLHGLSCPSPLLPPSLPEALRHLCSSGALVLLHRVPSGFLPRLPDTQARRWAAVWPVLAPMAHNRGHGGAAAHTVHGRSRCRGNTATGLLGGHAARDIQGARRTLLRGVRDDAPAGRRGVPHAPAHRSPAPCTHGSSGAEAERERTETLVFGLEQPLQCTTCTSVSYRGRGRWRELLRAQA